MNELPIILPQEQAPEPNEVADVLFNHRDYYFELLNMATILSADEIQNIRPELAETFSNQVLLTELSVNNDPEQASRHQSNGLKFFGVIKDGVWRAFAVFKPYSGERDYRRRDFGVANNFYSREIAASVIDYHAQLGVVPPTVKKEYHGDPGSLQLYIPPQLADTRERIPDLDFKALQESTDWKKMAMLDILISNADRNRFNYLVYRHNPTRLAAIDHGASFCKVNRRDHNEAIDTFINSPEKCELGDDLIQHLDKLLESQELVTGALPPEVRSLSQNMKYYNIFEKARRMRESGRLIFDHINS